MPEGLRALGYRESEIAEIEAYAVGHASLAQAPGINTTTLRAKGFTIIMVEQNFRFAAPLADRFYVMEHGKMVEGFSADELPSKMGMLSEYLGV